MHSSRTLRRRWIATLPVVVVAVAVVAACSGDAPKLPELSTDSHTLAWTAWKTSRATWLITPGRPLSYSGLHWLRQGANTIGGDSSNAVRLPGRNVPKTLGALIREGPNVRFEPAAGVAATIDSQPAVAGHLRADVDSGGASRVEVGSAGFRIMRRVDSVGVRTWDADRSTADAAAKTILPLTYYPLDPSWRVAGTLMRLSKPDTLAVPTSAGIPEVHIVVGQVKATVGGKPVRLIAFTGNGPTDLYFTFSDETSGDETYGFRFLHAAVDTLTNVVALDFNFAYNPDCAFSGFTTCPLPPTENRIPVRIPAGEKIVQHVDGDTTHVARANALTAKVKAGVPAGAKASVKP